LPDGSTSDSKELFLRPPALLTFPFLTLIRVRVAFGRVSAALRESRGRSSMKATSGKKQVEVASLVQAARANNFPDILFFAGGKVTVSGGESKFRIRASLVNGDDSDKIKQWGEEVKYTDPGYGNMFDAELLKRDLIEGDTFDFKFEVSTGGDYQEWEPVSWQIVEGPLNTPSVSLLAFLYDNGRGVSGTVGFMFMNV
jgi:hypothetical protein